MKQKKGNLAIAMEKLDLAIKIRQYHHNAIWEEQKHFTWLLSIVLTAQLIIFTYEKVDVNTKEMAIYFGSIFGMILAFVGFRIERREGSYFRDAVERYVREHNIVFKHQQIPLPSKVANKNIGMLFSAVISGTGGVRDYFQFLFLAFGMTFLSFALFIFQK